MERPPNNRQLKQQFRDVIDELCEEDRSKLKNLNEEQKARLARKLRKAIA